MIADQEVYSIFASLHPRVFAFLFSNLTRKAQRREECHLYRHVFRVCQHITDTFAKKLSLWRCEVYFEYSEVIKRFVSYLELVDPEIKETYQHVVDKFNSGYKDNERTAIWKKYGEIRDFSKKKSEELGKQLRQI